MKLTIGVMGSSGGDLSEEVRRKAYRLGEAIADRDAILITGGCPGLPYEAVRGAKAKGGLVVGISPGLSIYDEGRLLGVLTGTGGITEIVEEMPRHALRRRPGHAGENCPEKKKKKRKKIKKNSKS